jgi:hypothetical protein
MFPAEIIRTLTLHGEIHKLNQNLFLFSGPRAIDSGCGEQHRFSYEANHNDMLLFRDTFKKLADIDV